MYIIPYISKSMHICMPTYAYAGGMQTLVAHLYFTETPETCWTSPGTHDLVETLCQ